MTNKIARLPQRSFKVTETERKAARQSVAAFKRFLGNLEAARKLDKKVIDVLEKNKDADPEQLFQIRHLIRKYRDEVKKRYTDIVFTFSGKKDNQGNLTEEGVIHTLTALEKDTNTSHIKEALQDAMQQLVENIEEFLETFEDFSNPNQIKEIMSISQKVDKIISSIENIIDGQLQQHFEKNILGRAKIAEITGRIKRRIRIIEMIGDEE